MKSADEDHVIWASQQLPKGPWVEIVVTLLLFYVVLSKSKVCLDKQYNATTHVILWEAASVLACRIRVEAITM